MKGLLSFCILAGRWLETPVFKGSQVFVTFVIVTEGVSRHQDHTKALFHGGGSMTSVTKIHQSVDTNFDLFSFLPDRYGYLPNDSDKSVKRSLVLLQKGLWASEKGKTAMT